LGKSSGKSEIQWIGLLTILVLIPIQPYFLPYIMNTQSTTSIASSIGSVTTNTTAETNFSIIWITDTQYLSDFYPTYYNSLCQWIVAHANMYNVKMVIHTGDIVEDQWNRTQWENANSSMEMLLENGIPYCWNAGNHDFNATYYIGYQFSAFKPVTMQNESYWLGDMFSGENTAVHFTADNEDFLIINLAYDANSTTLSWATHLLDSYPTSHAIVVTHAFIDGGCRYSVWSAYLQNSVLDNHTNVFLTLNGHYIGNPCTNRTKVGNCNELYWNRQELDDQMGSASLRILTFDMQNNSVEVKTFIIYTNQFLTDPSNQFTLENIFASNSTQSVIMETTFPPFSEASILILFFALSAAVLIVFTTRASLPKKLKSIIKKSI